MEFETERLYIKVPHSASAQSILDFYLRNDSFLKEWEPVRDRNFFSLPYHEEQLLKERAAYKNQSSARFWLFKKECPDKTIGSVAFSNIVKGAFLSCFLGYKCDKDEINKGYITEAAKIGIAVMFGDFGLHRIEANIIPRNKRSLRVAEKLGFYNEGTAYKYLKINGVWEDHIHMVLLNDSV